MSQYISPRIRRRIVCILKDFDPAEMLQVKIAAPQVRNVHHEVLKGLDVRHKGGLVIILDSRRKDASLKAFIRTRDSRAGFTAKNSRVDHLILGHGTDVLLEWGRGSEERG